MGLYHCTLVLFRRHVHHHLADGAPLGQHGQGLDALFQGKAVADDGFQGALGVIVRQLGHGLGQLIGPAGLEVLILQNPFWEKGTTLVSDAPLYAEDRFD